MPNLPKTLRLHPEAQEELQVSVTFYRERAGEDWATRFKPRMAEGLSAIVLDPEPYPTVPDMPEVQKLRIKQFPFSLLYINRSNYVWIVAVVHGSRKPGYWKRRI